MIPKIIHYCWFGKGKMSPLAVRCIDSWKKFLPDYELRLWNEDNFDINSVPFVKEACEAKKYPFVTDYIRLYVLYHHGGIYMDADVEVIKNLDGLLNYPAFTGFEDEKAVPTGIMASERYGEWLKELLEYYDGRHFLLPDGAYDTTTNVRIISQIMTANGLIPDNTYQVYKGSVHIFPRDYFCPKASTGLVTVTENTFCIHHRAGSWLPVRLKLKKFIFNKIVGPEMTDKLVKLKRLIVKKDDKKIK